MEAIASPTKTKQFDPRTVLERMTDGIVAFDTDWNYVYLNPQAARMLGREKPENLLGKNYWKEYPEAKGTPFANAYVKALETQQPIIFEDYYQPWERWFENRLYPSNEGLTILFTEITERKRMELLLKTESEALALISTGASLPEILEHIVLSIEKLSHEVIASILLLDEDGLHVHYGAAAHLPDGYNKAIEGAEIGPCAGSCGTAAFRKQPVIVTDIETDPLWNDYRELARRHGLRACWSTPIINRTTGKMKIVLFLN